MDEKALLVLGLTALSIKVAWHILSYHKMNKNVVCVLNIYFNYKTQTQILNLKKIYIYYFLEIKIFFYIPTLICERYLTKTTRSFFGPNCICVRGVTIWNSIKIAKKNAPSFCTFKNKFNIILLVKQVHR